ncbi:hypothetical protein K8942_00090 [Candidatus Peribacteria bacterium]|nr:MAG: hypothetical protein K8942_00090 [Candidatus Peribacteria bacterium]
MPAFLTRIISISSPAFPVVLILPLAVVYFACFQSQLSQKNTAYFGGDTWEYQSMAVNFAYGHGVNTFGGVEPFETYQFGSMEWNAADTGMSNATYLDQKRRFTVDGRGDGSMNTFRMPLYTVFLGVIYAVAGVHPLIAKSIQLLLLTLVAGGLPLLGSLWWKKKGMIAGLLAGAPSVAATVRFADVILVESLAIAVLFLCVLGGVWYERRPGAGRAALLGALLGLCLLTKLSLILLPFLLFFLIWWRHPRHYAHYIRDMLLIVSIALITVLPWSIYASVRSHTFVIFSTESHNQGLFDAHNEYTAIDGEWHPEWETDPQSAYNTDGMEEYADGVRIAHFYLQHPTRMIRLPLSKMVAAFTVVPSIVLLVVFLMLEGLMGSLLTRRSVRLAALVFGLSVWWMLMDDRMLYATLMPLVNTPYLWGLLPGVTAIIALLLRRVYMPSFPPIPLMVTAVALNFVLMMILVMSDSAIYMSRHVKVAEFLWILLAALMLVHWIAALITPSLQTHD